MSASVSDTGSETLGCGEVAEGLASENTLEGRAEAVSRQLGKDLVVHISLDEAVPKLDDCASITKCWQRNESAERYEMQESWEHRIGHLVEH